MKGGRATIFVNGEPLGEVNSYEVVHQSHRGEGPGPGLTYTVSLDGGRRVEGAFARELEGASLVQLVRLLEEHRHYHPRKRKERAAIKAAIEAKRCATANVGGSGR